MLAQLVRRAAPWVLFVVPCLAAEVVTVTMPPPGKTSVEAIAHGIERARQVFATHPGATVELVFASGEYDLNKATKGRQGVIEVDDLHPSKEGRLIFRGAGMEKTTLFFPKGSTWISGKDSQHLTFTGLHMSTREMTVSQGHVVSTGKGLVILDIQTGFPSPMDIFDPDMSHGRYLREFTNSAQDPHIIEGQNQYDWTKATAVSGSRWRIVLGDDKDPAYKKGALIGIKSKQTGNTYYFAHCSDLNFEAVKWTQISRGVFREGTDRITFLGCVVERMPAINGQVPCLSTPDGGPQIGQPNDPPITGNRVENCRFTGTGDDAIAFFNASGLVANNYVADSFARGILLHNSPNVTVKANTLLRCELAKK